MLNPIPIKEWLLLFSYLCIPLFSWAIPNGFVYLREIDPSILQEIRYASDYNILGHPLAGYEQPVCILTKKAALALKKVQMAVKRQGFSLKVYDCYRPKQAVTEMLAWSHDPETQAMKLIFYPRETKATLFTKGYIALYSGHSRGSTVDLTLVALNQIAYTPYAKTHPLKPCYANDQIHDNSIDMGTAFDCLDQAAHLNSSEISAAAYNNRLILKRAMERYGFIPYLQEWWHFTLRHEPYRKYFDFVVR